MPRIRGDLCALRKRLANCGSISFSFYDYFILSTVFSTSLALSLPLESLLPPPSKNTLSGVFAWRASGVHVRTLIFILYSSLSIVIYVNIAFGVFTVAKYYVIMLISSDRQYRKIMGFTQEQFEYFSQLYKDCIQDMLCQNMPFFKFRKQPVWGFMFNECCAVLGTTNKATNTVNLNIAAIDFAFRHGQPLVIEQFALHEFRHLYQFGEIESYSQGNYDGTESIDKIQRWARGYEQYIGPKTSGENTVKEYYDQDLEFDAFTFSYAVMKFKYNELPSYIEVPKYYVGKYEPLVDEWIKVFHKKFNV